MQRSSFYRRDERVLIRLWDFEEEMPVSIHRVVDYGMKQVIP